MRLHVASPPRKPAVQPALEPRPDTPAPFARTAEPFVLLILCNGRSHGYELRRTLQQFDLPRAQKDPPALYRLLRDLEAAGLIVSSWEPGGAGPARRYYELTLAGREQLDRSATHLARQMHRLQLFFETYSHVAEA